MAKRKRAPLAWVPLPIATKLGQIALLCFFVYAIVMGYIDIMVDGLKKHDL